VVFTVRSRSLNHALNKGAEMAPCQTVPIAKRGRSHEGAPSIACAVTSPRNMTVEPTRTVAKVGCLAELAVQVLRNMPPNHHDWRGWTQASRTNCTRAKHLRGAPRQRRPSLFVAQAFTQTPVPWKGPSAERR